MAKKFPLTQSITSIYTILEWYNAIKTILEQFIFKKKNIPPYFIGERTNYFFTELDYIVNLTLLAQAEATLRKDFKNRVSNQYHSKINMEFSALHKNAKQPDRISIEDILNIWEKHFAKSSKAFNDFRNAWKYRNWLAHGRYWPLKTDNYSVESVFLTIKKLLETLSLKY